MNSTALFKIEEKYWNFNPIGTGVVFTYIPRARQVVTTCANSRQIIEVKKYPESEAFNSIEEFYETAVKIYAEMIEEGLTIDIDCFDEVSIVGGVGINFDLIKN
jgi:hypothetical protein